MSRRILAAAITALALSVASCGSSPATDPVSQSVTVFAAASLKGTFTELGHIYEQQHPGATVTFNFGGSNSLLEQLTNGAKADVLATADQATMAKAAQAGVRGGDSAVFASNILTIVTPPGNPANITTFADLAKPGVSLVVCAPQVPCGAATTKVAAGAGVALSPVSEESSVTDVLAKVTSGQADAGLVYVTDAKSAGAKVTTIEFPESATVVNEYPIARTLGGGNPDGGDQFIDLVLSEDGRKVLQEQGFR